jgi:hypothetical protein
MARIEDPGRGSERSALPRSGVRAHRRRHPAEPMLVARAAATAAGLAKTRTLHESFHRRVSLLPLRRVWCGHSEAPDDAHPSIGGSGLRLRRSASPAADDWDVARWTVMRTKKAIVPLSAVPTIARRIEAAFARKRLVMTIAPAE